MTRALAIIGLVFLLGFAIYGGVRLASDTLTEEDGEKAAKAAHPFVQGAATVAHEKAKEALKNTPDEQLEKDAELYARKLYPVAKGALKGQLEAIAKDPNSGEIPQMMRQAGKDVTERVIKPFTEGLAQGSGSVLKDLDKTMENVRTFTEENRDLIESVTSGLKGLHQTLKENAPTFPHPPLPGLKPLDQLPSQPGQAPWMRQSDRGPGTDSNDRAALNESADSGYHPIRPPLPLPQEPFLPPQQSDSHDQYLQRVPRDDQSPDRNRDARNPDGGSPYNGAPPTQEKSPSNDPQSH